MAKFTVEVEAESQEEAIKKVAGYEAFKVELQAMYEAIESMLDLWMDVIGGNKRSDKVRDVMGTTRIALKRFG